MTKIRLIDIFCSLPVFCNGANFWVGAKFAQLPAEPPKTSLMRELCSNKRKNTPPNLKAKGFQI
ncbi:MAG: hypothetical protein AUJ89_01110 [Candidatus Omnitrophica bacterium CG1_02_43_210]|nr:MAG: hypothetical protein AUJ89_01110 [Candidatus Omnitrophica bacterium CG1_02_43_210]